MGENVTFPISRAKNGFKSKGFPNVLILDMMSLVFSAKKNSMHLSGENPL